MRLTADLRGGAKFTDDAFTDLHDSLLKLFDLINGTHPDRNRATDVTRYNGGLFDPALHPDLTRWRVGDKTLADVLRLLIFDQPAGKNRRQRTIRTEETIDYAALEVRQLGDIYEGLLGAQLRENAAARIELVNANGQNHRHGIFYTPDWIVLYLLRETFAPLLAEVTARDDVQRALAKRNEEQRRDNSFALAVLGLRIVDPAMGSGHFLVRATEFLARKIREHPTTKLMTEQIVATGGSRRTREQTLAAGRHPVPPGVSQEQAETAYWRRRVVESCIHGVDLNPMAVELAKLSLWLTCIAADEPLNFLDHHLRHGNSLIFAEPWQLPHLPIATREEKEQAAFHFGEHLPVALAHVIRTNSAITGMPSTAMEEVKQKEDAWKKVREKIKPFLTVAHLWVAAGDALRFSDEPGKPPRELNELDYQTAARMLISPDSLDGLPAKDRRKAESLRDGILAALDAKAAELQPFHWHLEFPAVFYHEDGRQRADAGFDAILGNPPYISTQTSSAEAWRNALGRRDGWLDDLYVHFTALGFALLRAGGGYGFIVSDTFFTLATKLRMRELLQRHRLTHLGQCDPFDATVDAAIFIARKSPPEPQEDATLLFIQARPREGTKPDEALDTLPPSEGIPFSGRTRFDLGEILHGAHSRPGHATADLRVHRTPLALYRSTHDRIFFEPRATNFALWQRFNQPVCELSEEWWERIEASDKFAANRSDILRYAKALKPGAITLVGLIAEGGQGLATGNNFRFLGYLDGTAQADEIEIRRVEWSRDWLRDPAIGPRFRALLKDAGGEPDKPTRDKAAWEACAEPLCAEFGKEKLGITRMDLCRIAPPALVATADDFVFSWQTRKAELLKRWQTNGELAPFWHTTLGLSIARTQLEKLHKAKAVSDDQFIAICREIQCWAAGPPNGKRRAPREAVGLRSGENYTDAADAPRIATIYAGLRGRARFVPYSKGDETGNRWAGPESLYIEWTEESVKQLQTDPRARWQNHQLFLLGGVSWSDTGNHVALKARWIPVSVNDVKSMKLSPVIPAISPSAFLAVISSDVFSYIAKKFINNTCMYQVNDLRQAPIVIPTKAQAARLEKMTELALRAKRHDLDGTHPDNALVTAVRPIEAELAASGPEYLRPGAQQKLLATAADCLAILERAVSWEAERLYGVEGLGPFDEF